jgi:hypothetical protein
LKTYAAIERSERSLPEKEKGETELEKRIPQLGQPG